MKGLVTVKGIGRLKKQLPTEITVDSGQTVAQVAKDLQLIQSETILALVNRRIVSWDHSLKPGDELRFIQGVGGGL